jgi:uncharacterized membrane protein SirB2
MTEFNAIPEIIPHVIGWGGTVMFITAHALITLTSKPSGHTRWYFIVNLVGCLLVSANALLMGTYAIMLTNVAQLGISAYGTGGQAHRFSGIHANHLALGFLMVTFASLIAGVHTASFEASAQWLSYGSLVLTIGGYLLFADGQIPKPVYLLLSAIGHSSTIPILIVQSNYSIVLLQSVFISLTIFFFARRYLLALQNKNPRTTRPILRFLK